MKILITGSTGLLGQALVRRLAASHDVVGLSRRPATSTPAARAHVCCDLTDSVATAAAIGAVQPAVVIHSQAMSDVDRCELAPDEAWRQNVAATESVRRASESQRAWLVSLSSDYVFDGLKGQPYDELDELRPLSVYGRTKVESERIVRGYERGAVVRVSTLYGAGRTNFCDVAVERLRAGQAVEAFTDQATSPTFTDDVAMAIERLINAIVQQGRVPSPSVFHIANAGGCRRIDLVGRIARLIGADPALIRPIRMDAQRRPARRPACTILMSRFIHALTGSTLRPWERALEAYLRQRQWIN